MFKRGHLVALFVILFAVFVHVEISFLTQLFEDDVNVSFRNYGDCKKLKADGFIGAEDFVRVSEHLFITGADDRLSLWEISSPNLTAPGGLFAISTSLNQVRALPLHNFPSEVVFHPHGLYLFSSKGHQLLYVINHAYQLGGERIDVFKVKGSSIDQLSLDYFQTIKSEKFSELTGTLNDLIVVEPGQLFVTQYRSYPDMLDGRGFHSSTFTGKFYGILCILYPLLGIKGSPTWFCSFDPDHPGEIGASCNVASEPLLMSNGITIDKDGFVYVACPVSKTVTVYKRENNQLIFSTFFRTPRGIDNLIPDPSTSKIYGGSLVSKESADFSSSLSQHNNQKPEKFISGGIIEISVEKSTLRNNYLVSQPIVLPGSVFSGISVATREADKILFGSWYDDGVLLCTLKQ